MSEIITANLTHDDVQRIITGLENKLVAAEEERDLFREIVEAISREDIKYQLPSFIQSAILAALRDK